MKNIVLIFLGAIILVSCGKSKGEQMLYDYQQNNVKALNFDLKDLDFKIEKVEKISDVFALDSAKYYKKQLAQIWDNNADSSLMDTLTFNYVKKSLIDVISHEDTLIKLYQESVLTGIKIDDYMFEYNSRKKRDKAINDKADFEMVLYKVERLEGKYNSFFANPDSILSTKYNAVYSLKNPMLSNVKQTFDKVYYTNAEQTKFIKEETVN